MEVSWVLLSSEQRRTRWEMMPHLLSFATVVAVVVVVVPGIACKASGHGESSLAILGSVKP